MRAAEAQCTRGAGGASGRESILSGRGAVAQPGERLLCKQEARGSSPLGSTTLLAAPSTPHLPGEPGEEAGGGGGVAEGVVGGG